MKKVAINGLGRIGRMVFRIAAASDELELVAVNASYPAETLAHLLNYDTTHGKWEKHVEAKEGKLVIDGSEVQITNERNPENLPWESMGVDLVIEATGAFNHGDKAIAHVKAGAKKVLLTAPAKGGDVQTVVLGVNDEASISIHMMYSQMLHARRTVWHRSQRCSMMSTASTTAL